ncbi:MAG TPA: bifunctional nuclease family protein [Nitrospiraceae bacterium]|nr:bifunctional nuclease family protein [Nitrospiraceae bacterium]
MEQTHESADLIRLKVHGVLADPNTETQIVILRDENNADILPIWVGTAEGNAIRLALEGIVTPRPMSHDLIRSFAEHLNIKVSRVVVTDVKNNTYYASIHLVSEESERLVDSRPSDAIALALRTHSPIYVTADVLKQRGGGNLDAWLEKLDTKNFGKYEV